MKSILCFSLLSFSIVFILTGCNQPERKSSRWYKGNLHTHSYWSDGDEFPEMIMDWYKSNGYDFVALSDHNVLAEGEKWILVAKSRMYEEGFEKYLKKYGPEWVEHKMDTGRIHVRLKTFTEYPPLFEDESFLIIKAEEITDNFMGKPIHINATNIQSLISPQGGESVTDVMQRNVDAVLQQRAETGIPMFPHINHPNFYYAITIEDMIDLRGERFFEVYNGHPMVNNYGDSLRPGTEEMWDLINIAYLKKGQPLLFGLATDDSHNYHQYGSSFSNAGRGWVMVRADSLSPRSLIRAMEAGDFYSSTGVTLQEISFDQNRLQIVVQPEAGLTYEIQFIGALKGVEKTHVLKSTKGTEANFEVTAEHQFIRAKVISDKVKENPFQEGEFEVAWTQPVVYTK